MDEGPKTFGRYEVLRSLGSGGMGEVFLARQRGVAGVDRLVVLKTVLPHLARDPGFIERFVDEMRVSMLLTHGNIVQVYDVGEEGGRYYMAMEWVEGLDLREVLLRLDRAGRSIPEEVALHILVEAGKGLAYAHARRDPMGRPLALVHRDISPANVLISNDGQVKITDFGVAIATSRLSFSIPGTLHGKVAYMSPEQVLGGDLDGRSDQFSLGVVAYEMLCGERPFDAESDVAILEQVRRCEPRPLWEVAPWLDPNLTRIVMRAMARDPQARFPTMDDFIRALTDYLFAARKVVSARVVAEFMLSIQESSSPPEAGARPSLDEVARGLLAEQVLDSRDRVTIEARAGEALSPAPVVAEGRFTAWNVVGAVALLFGLAAGAFILGRFIATTPGPIDAGDVLESDDSGTLLEDVVFDPGAPEVADTMVSGNDPPEGRGSAPAIDARRLVQVRSVPEGATVFHGARRLGVTPLVVAASRPMRLSLRLAGHEDATATVGPDSPGTIEVHLNRLPMGRIRFRFFPADARVFLDDDPLQPHGNVVDHAVTAGEHILTIRSREESGTIKTIRVEVRPDQVVELGTIELPAGP